MICLIALAVRIHMLDSFLFQLIKNKKNMINFEVTEQSSVIILYLNDFYLHILIKILFLTSCVTNTGQENPGKSYTMIYFSMVLYQSHISNQINATLDHTD